MDIGVVEILVHAGLLVTIAVTGVVIVMSIVAKPRREDAPRDDAPPTPPPAA